jgi:hypothetical protein
MKKLLLLSAILFAQLAVTGNIAQAAQFKVLKEFVSSDLQAISEDFMAFCEPLIDQAEYPHACRVDRAKITSVKTGESLVNSMKQYQYKLFLEPGMPFEISISGKEIVNTTYAIDKTLKYLISGVSFSDNPETQMIDYLGIQHSIEPMRKEMNFFQFRAYTEDGYAHSLVMFDPSTDEFLTMSVSYSE